MPFLLYRVADAGRLERIREVQLAGTGGPFATSVRQRVAGGEAPPIGWHLSEREILDLLGLGAAIGHALLIDVKPKSKSAASSLRLCDVWGFSDAQWTPIYLRLEELYSDEPVDAVDQFKASLPAPTAGGPLVHEFLYLLGGTTESRWTWGLVGRVNGALLWPDALQFFVSNINAADAKAYR